MTDLDIHIRITNADAHMPIDDVFTNVAGELYELFEGETEHPTEIEIDIKKVDPSRNVEADDCPLDLVKNCDTCKHDGNEAWDEPCDRCKLSWDSKTRKISGPSEWEADE